MATLALIAWITLAVILWREGRPAYRRMTGRKLTIPILLGLKRAKRH